MWNDTDTQAFFVSLMLSIHGWLLHGRASSMQSSAGNPDAGANSSAVSHWLNEAKVGRSFTVFAKSQEVILVEALDRNFFIQPKSGSFDFAAEIILSAADMPHHPVA